MKLKFLTHLLLITAFNAGMAEAQLNIATRSNLRFEVVYSGSSGVVNDPAKQADINQGLDMALRMWQSVIPDFRYRFVTASGNVRIVFGNYNVVSPVRSYHRCPGTGWTACSFFPTTTGDLPSDPAFPGEPAIIYMNDFGRADPNRYAFSYGVFTGVTRQQVYSAYQPATLPPSYYNIEAGNPGFLTGRFRNASSLVEMGADVSGIFFHEWAHSLGMNHHQYQTSDYINWYGRPWNGTTQPPQPQQNGTGFTNPALPASYYGGGTCTLVPFTRANGTQVNACNDDGFPGGNRSAYSPWTPDLRGNHPSVFSHVMGNDNTNPPTGVPLPPYAQYNNRVVWNDDLSAPSLPQYPWTYPEIGGVIRLLQGTTPYLTSDWYQAISQTQLRSATQSNPFIVEGIFPRTATQWTLAAGNSHSAGLRRDGTLWSWGDNTFGQMGRGATGPDQASPENVSEANGTLPRFRSVSASNCHTLALAQDGRAFAFGCNESGRLGTGDNFDRNRPTQVCNDAAQGGCFNNRYAVISAGGNHNLAIRQDGTLWSWGGGGFGELGQGQSVGRMWPGPVGSDNTWIAVATSAAYHSAAIRRDGTLWTWGRNHLGQLADASRTDRNAPVQESRRSTAWASVAMGWDATYAIRTDGTLWSAGSNSQGQLGHTYVPVGAYSPVFEQVGNDNSWIAVSGGFCHALALRADGSLWSWGCNGNGQLGDNSTTTRLTPVRVCDANASPCTFNARYSAIEAGGGHSLAVRIDGRLWAWGMNESGQGGLAGSLPGTDRRTPGQTAWRQNVISITAATPSSNTNLTAEGFADWVRFTNLANPIRKSGANQIGIGSTANVQTFSSTAVLFNWSMDGADPNINGNSSGGGVSLANTTDRFSLTFPVGPSRRVLRLYVGADRAAGELRVTVSDNSSSAVTQTVSNQGGVTNRVYSINCSSAGQGATVTVQWRMTQSFGGAVRLLSASLQ